LEGEKKQVKKVLGARSFIFVLENIRYLHFFRPYRICQYRVWFL